MAAKCWRFKRLNKDYRWPWKLRLSTSWRWKRVTIRFSFFDDVVFHVLYFLEAIVLVAAFGCFFLCCGCHF
ncbi:uncharacterized protein LOC103709866 [Phoenix dactylifera]|uniref:Uncharacterized protein LOC103709866 n=1 Tax=Phoenix dactylifera TaxID=42345 RepID=A0A8B7C817_PHODC|nr:uncharacterized protein LOC103709866 [Phoenix dactylifera]